MMPALIGLRILSHTFVKDVAVSLHAENSQPVVITLVHGTYARGAAWCKPSSSLCTALQNSLGNNVRFEIFDWSGLNLHRARVKAGNKLQSYLRTLHRETPTHKHFIIGHSHGGNVIRYAMSASDIANSVDGVITLATPFLSIEPRNYQRTLRVMAFLFSMNTALISMLSVIGFILTIVAITMENGLRGVDKIVANHRLFTICGYRLSYSFSRCVACSTSIELSFSPRSWTYHLG
ncbi:esterase/lipase family protein [Methylobacterium sp. D53M]